MISSQLLSLTLTTDTGERFELCAEDLSALGCTFRMPKDEALRIIGRPCVLRAVYRGLKETAAAETPVAPGPEDETPWFIRLRAEWPEDPVFSALMRKMMSFLQTYTRLKNAGDDGILSGTLTGYPAQAERMYPESYTAWRRNALSALTPDPDWGEALGRIPSLAAAVTDPRRADAFLSGDIRSYWQAMLTEAGLAGHPLSARTPDAVLLGHMTCPGLMPEPARLAALLDHCETQGLAPVLLLPPMPEDRLGAYRTWLRIAADRPQAMRPEIVLGDPGPALMASEMGLALRFTAGPLLIRRRKDPRMRWWLGDPALLRETSGDSDSGKRWLARCGIRGALREACGYPADLQPGDTLTLPFFQLNTATACTLRAVCRTGRRDGSTEGGRCERECLTRCFLYGQPLGMTGRFNSLWGLDPGSLTDSALLRAAAEAGVRRIAVDLL